jgi:HTH-type transcriptional regulator/antitoxin HipB
MKHILLTPTQVGQLLQSARRAAGLSQTELASRVGLSQPRLSTLENNAGAATVDQLLALCSTLGLELFLQKRGDSDTESSTRPVETPPSEW